MTRVIVNQEWLKACGMSDLIGKPLEVATRSARKCALGHALTVRIPGRKDDWTVFEARIEKLSFDDGIGIAKPLERDV